MKDNPFKTVEGKAPSKTEMVQWTDHKWIHLLRFIETFIEADPKKGEVFRVNDSKREMLEATLEMPDHPFTEFIWRIGLWRPKNPDKEYSYKLTAFARITLTFLKDNQQIITEEMRQIIESHPARMAWCLEAPAAPEDAPSSLDIIQDAQLAVSKYPSLHAQMVASLTNVINFYDKVSESFTEKDLKKLGVMDRAKILKDLSFIFSAVTKKTAATHFTQINMNTNDPKEMEKSLLDYAKNKYND